ncbi:hypothetical protein IE81DRAFT_295304 [Ceraceosorus guamensis]|uniref:Uncharacterized protein n=1 Tax=Ceraceosorus guamensis TaxID=1522189 RepID=A0A316VNM2_9BASI|nr:hypothetical protein IE81DRAFT_295304 [Ceraceosorus guamensis]PWN39132.1 hypothetical protein IE81DRAFT_295304 [Ceraceosorus guamensis]
MRAVSGAQGLGTLPQGIGSNDPKTPAEYALNVLMSRWVQFAGSKVEACMHSGDREIDLNAEYAEGADEVFDALLSSIAHVARKSTSAVVHSLKRWRDLQLEISVDAEAVRQSLAHLGHSATSIAAATTGFAGGQLGVKDAAALLSRRKALASAYLLCRALGKVAEQSGIGTLSESAAHAIEADIFGIMLACSRERTAKSDLQAAAFQSAAALLGQLSSKRFVAIGDRFVALLEQCAKSPSRESDSIASVAVQGAAYLKITVYPMELFEEGADFVETLSRYFAASHGQVLKSTYASALTHILLPVAQLASAELNHPTWLRALEAVSPRALAMCGKPRYWQVAYPLYVACLCASPEERLLQAASGGWNWISCIEAGMAKLKDRGTRNIVLNAAVRLLWAYIFRCRESSNTTTKRLEHFFRLWFPTQRPVVLPSDASLIPHIVMTHLVLYRHFDFGRDLVLDFLRASALSGNTLSLQPELLWKQRMTIAVRAITLTLDAYVQEKSPPFPSHPDFATFAGLTLEQRSGLGDELAPDFKWPRPEIGEAQSTFNDLIGKVALICDHQVGSASIFEDGLAIVRSGAPRPQIDDERLVWLLHSTLRTTVAFPRDHEPYCELLRACFDSWPRCLSASIPFGSVLSALFRGYFSADPRLSASAAESLRRIAQQRKGGAAAIVSGFMRYLFKMDVAFWETHPHQSLLLAKVEHAVKLWTDFLNTWLNELRKSQDKHGMERTSAWAIIDEVEAYGFFLLCSAWRALRRHAISILRLVAVLDETFLNPARRKALATARAMGEEEDASRVIHLLDKPCAEYCNEEDASLSESQVARIKKWRRPSSAEALSELAESDGSIEHSLWQHVLPHFLRMCLEHFPTTVAVFRSYVTRRVLAMESAVANVAGMHTAGTTRTVTGSGAALPTSVAEQQLMAAHWKLYVLCLCTTTTSSEREHARHASGGGGGGGGDDANERGIAAKDLFHKLVPFLGTDQAQYRDAVVNALGNINGNLYRALLETTQTVSAQLNDDFRQRSAPKSGHRKSRHSERLRTAVAHVMQLTSTHMGQQDAVRDVAIATFILNWIKDTFAFLTDREVRQDWEFHRLRRYFCGVVEEFTNALAKLHQTESHLNFDMRLRMFRLLREYHSFSQAAKDGPAKLANLLASVGEQYRDDKHREGVLTALRNETQQLSYHAGSAMASLCQGAISLVGSAAPAPMAGSSLDADSLLSWLEHLFSSHHAQYHAVARRALHALLIYNATHPELVGKTINLCFAEAEDVAAPRSFFAVLGKVLVEHDTFDVPIHQSLCLGLIKLGHPDHEIRRRAFVLLESLGRKCQSDLGLQDLEAGVASPLPATYLRAQREVSAHLAFSLPLLKIAMLSEYTLRLPTIDIGRRATTLGLIPEWLDGLVLSESLPFSVADHYRADAEVPGTTFLILTNLTFLTIKYGDEHNFEIQDMWTSLAEGPEPGINATFIVRFLIEQALHFRSSIFVVQAKRAISCLSRTIISPVLFAELCARIEPSSAIPVPRDGASPLLDATHAHLHCANLAPLLLDPSRRQTFSPGQLALLLVGELTYERSGHLEQWLPLLLHAIFMQIDSVSSFMQEQMMSMLEQVMRTVTSAPTSTGFSVTSRTAKQQVESMFAKGSPSLFWSHDDLNVDLDQTRTPRMMRATLNELLAALDSLYPGLRAEWGRVSLQWATSSPVRHMACRSFQTFRILLPTTTPTMLADMLNRLGNTISDPSVDIQTFALEVLYTLTAVVRSAPVGETEILIQTFWCCLACLSTANEREFAEALALLDALLDKIDIGSRETIDLLRARCPEGWEGDAGSIQTLVLRGLRSSGTSTAAFNILARLAKVKNGMLVDSTNDRLAFTFVAALPWFLQSSDAPHTQDSNVLQLADDIAILAAAAGKMDLQRVATSIVKARFRTKDDLVRQAVGCIKDHYLPNLGPDLVVLLLGISLNQHEWLRKQTLQVLKVFFQVIDTRSGAFANLGSELLMPLLRLLSTPLSAEALDVLDEPIVINGGPAANQILRMSLQWGKPSRRREQSSDAAIFGAPDDSGWAVAHPQEMTTRSRINVQAVFKTCELSLETAPVGEVMFVDEGPSDDPQIVYLASTNGTDSTANMDDLGGALNQLHDLSNFFVEPDAPNPSETSHHLAAQLNHADGNFAGQDDDDDDDEHIARIMARSAFAKADHGNGPSAYSASDKAGTMTIREARAAGMLPSLDPQRSGSLSDSDASSPADTTPTVGDVSESHDQSHSHSQSQPQPQQRGWRPLFRSRNALPSANAQSTSAHSHERSLHQQRAER